jgi:hypothetical protein
MWLFPVVRHSNGAPRLRSASMANDAPRLGQNWKAILPDEAGNWQFEESACVDIEFPIPDL